MYFICGSKRGKTRHYMDGSVHKRVSTGKALCNKPGKELIRFDAAYFNYEAVYPKMCKDCAKIADAHPEIERAEC